MLMEVRLSWGSSIGGRAVLEEKTARACGWLWLVGLSLQ